MRSVSTEWQDIQSEIVTPSGAIGGFIETKDASTLPDTTHRWLFGTDSATKNVMGARIISIFDPSRVTLPIESCSVELVNATRAAEGEFPVDAYDFTSEAVMRQVAFPGRIDIDLGYHFDDGDTELKAMTSQHLADVEVSTNGLFVTAKGDSFTTRLDEFQFNKGRYVEGGIAASTLFTEILEDADFPGEGTWAYRLGQTDCVISEEGTNPIWAEAAFVYYTIDPALDDIMVHIPIPSVTHREALVMLAAYCNCYLLYKSDGSLAVTTTLGGINDYHMNIGRTHDRPATTRGIAIGKIRGFLHSYGVSTTLEQIGSVDVSVEAPGTASYFISHEACEVGSFSLVGATLFGTPTHYTYGTAFYATCLGTKFTAVVNGYRVTIGSSAFDVTYPQTGGEIKEYDNPIASDAALTTTMFNAYVEVMGQTTYAFTFRDDPAIEVGDRLYLDTLAVPTGFPVLVVGIDRTFNGATLAEYTVITDPNPDWVQEDFIQLDSFQYAE